MNTSQATPNPTAVGRAALPWWTWILPVIIFHFGTGLSLNFRINQGMSLWYLPVSLGIVLVHWWGPRVLIGLYLNALLCAGYWGLYRWWYWPLYALPETLLVGLSWWLFSGLAKGKCWFPDLGNTWKFLLLGIALPGLIAAYSGQALFVALGDHAPLDFWRIGFSQFVLDVLNPLAIAFPILLFSTTLMEKSGLTLTAEAHLRPALVLSGRLTDRMKYEALAAFAAMFVVSLCLPLEKAWFIYGIFLTWAAIRFGIGVASFGGVWIIFLALLLPALRTRGFADHWAREPDLQNVNLNLAVLCASALVVGRALSDLFQEIDGRASAEAELTESEGKYRMLFENASDGILLSDDGMIVECNRRSEDLFGGPREAIVGYPSVNLMAPMQADGVSSESRLAEIRNEVLGGQSKTVEVLARRNDGTPFDAEASLNGVSIDGKQMMLVVIRDLSDRRRIERALVESEERFRQMAENIQEIFFLLNRATETMLYVSPVAESILGLPVANITARPFAINEYMHPGDRERVGFFQDGAWYKRSFNEDFRFLHPDGGLRWLRLRSFLIRDAEGEVFRVAGVVADITEYKVAQESARTHQQQIIQADKMNSLGMMVSGVAHEINNPNNLIMLNADVLETFWRHLIPVLREHSGAHPDWKVANIPYSLAEGKFEALINGLSGGAKRIKRIVDNLKDFARIDGGDITESIAMDKVIEASVGIVENLIRKSTDHFSIVHGENLPRIKGNFQKLEQVVINLITNACQALESRSKAIRIATWYEKDGNMVVLRVNDEGKGIPKDLLGKVADPFFTTKRNIGGTGLGLSVSYGIIQEHQGDIRFDSQVDQGTSIEIRIPALAG